MIPSHWEFKGITYWPPGSNHEAASRFKHKLINMAVIVSVSEMENGDTWHHLSVSRPDRIPNWIELAKVKNEFLGEEAEAFHIIPKKRDYINIHKFCIHIWSPIVTSAKLPNLQDLVNERAL